MCSIFRCLLFWVTSNHPVERPVRWTDVSGTSHGPDKISSSLFHLNLWLNTISHGGFLQCLAFLSWASNCIRQSSRWVKNSGALSVLSLFLKPPKVEFFLLAAKLFRQIVLANTLLTAEEETRTSTDPFYVGQFIQSDPAVFVGMNPGDAARDLGLEACSCISQSAHCNRDKNIQSGDNCFHVREHSSSVSLFNIVWECVCSLSREWLQFLVQVVSVGI